MNEKKELSVELDSASAILIQESINEAKQIFSFYRSFYRSAIRVLNKDEMEKVITELEIRYGMKPPWEGSE